MSGDSVSDECVSGDSVSGEEEYTHNKSSCAFGLVLPGPEALDELPRIPQGTN